MVEFIKIEASSEMQVDVDIDLTAYIEAYEAIDKAKDKQNKDNAITNFTQIYQGVAQKLSGIVGQSHWIDIRESATENLSDEDREDRKEKIKNSPANEMLNNSFIEILKNSMDEAISRYYDSNMTESPNIKLKVGIDDTSTPGVISIKIQDSGPGFNDEFVSKLKTEQGRNNYIKTSGGSTKQKHPDRPPLFGGQGRGLRILIADANGDALERGGIPVQRFVKPDVSHVDIDNYKDQNNEILGAEITITTSIKPREYLINRYKRDVIEIKSNESSPTRTQSTESLSSQSKTPSISPLSLDIDTDTDTDTDTKENEESEHNDNFSPQPPRK